MKLSRRRSAWCGRSLQQAAEYLHDCGRIGGRKGRKLSFGREHAIRNHRVGVRVPIPPIGAVRPQTHDTARSGIAAVNQRWEKF
jgi:hypothetical protein